MKRKSHNIGRLASSISVAVFAMTAATGQMQAAITGGSVTGGTALTKGGQFVQLTVPWGTASNPVNTVGDNDFGTPNLYAFNEAQNMTLTSALAADVGLTSIAAGTTVSSQFVTFEPGNALNLIGDVLFSSKVLAIITSGGLLVSSNFLGDPAVTYQDPTAVGLEPGDYVTIDPANPDEIEWNTSASTPGDSVRVITAVTSTSSVPEPSVAAFVILGGLLLASSMLRRVDSKCAVKP